MKEEQTIQIYQAEICKILGYFDFFKYPLNKQQILLFASIKIDDLEAFDKSLKMPFGKLNFLEKDSYFALQDIDAYVLNRIEGEQRFIQLNSRIQKTACRLSYFPFVKFVGLSGSLSKGYATKNADIDLFIITDVNRLWICRSILHLMKKLSFLKGSQHWYCMNYFIDETALKIEEQNFFTAIELATLKPLIDSGGYHKILLEQNQEWLFRELPNFKPIFTSDSLQLNPTFFSKLIAVFSTEKMNVWLMKLTDKKWRSKWKKRNYPADDYDLAFKTRINISKNHLHNYQKKLLQHLNNLPQSK